MGNLLTLNKDIQRKLAYEYLDAHDIILLAYSVGIKLEKIKKSQIIFQ